MGDNPKDHPDDDGWNCPSCGAWWSDDNAADYCPGCHEKVVFPEDQDC